MMHHDDGHDEFRQIAGRLRDERPTATPLELDALKQRVLARAVRPSPTTRRSLALMRTRAAILSMLVFGFLLSTTGAGLAVTGLTDNDQAAEAQYPPPPAAQPQPEAPSPQSNVLPETEQNTPPAEDQVLPEENVAPEERAVAPEQSAPLPTRQVEAAADTGPHLPFTGFAALPVLLLGLALLSGGLIIRRSTRAD
jgi:hypothetical protein